MTDVATKESKAEALKARSEEVAAEELKLNAGKTGKGTRTVIGFTRGRNPMKITYEAFDESQPDTLPKTLSEFMDLTKTSEESVIMGYVIDGFNSAAYANSSDPVSEFVDALWSEEVQKQFRTAVRSYANMVGVSIEDAVALIKPGVAASQAKK